MRHAKTLIALVLLAGLLLWWRQQAPAPVPADIPPGAAVPANAPSGPPALPTFLPPEARDTLARIARGGPFPYRQDGVVFQNREGLLPAAPRGTYHEYTVRTPGSHDRGARRIITAGTPPTTYWYTDDHYRSFRRFEVPR